MAKNGQFLSNFISQLDFLLGYAEKIYLVYIGASKQFLYTQILFNVNKDVVALVNLNSHLLPENRKEDAMRLLFHLDVWSVLWKSEVEKQSPQLNDCFTFANEITFPNESVKRLLKLRG
jgi:hypothetical protein